MKYINIGLVTILSLGFMTLFTAFNTCQNFSSKVLNDDGFENTGFITLAVLYLVFALCSLISAAIVNWMNNAKTFLCLGAICYSFWIISFLLPSYYSERDDKSDLPLILNK